MTLPARRNDARPAARWDPVTEFEDLYDRMGRLMDSFWGGSGHPAGGLAWSPLADVTETDDAYLVEADLPGVKRDQVDVQVAGGEIVISGETPGRERHGVLRRAALPRDVDPEKVSASLADGVLTVRVPKGEKSRPRRIEITAA